MGKYFKSPKEIFCFSITILGFCFIAYWEPCWFTFCKTTHIPDWLMPLFVPIPFLSGILIALVLTLPAILFCSFRLGIAAIALSAALISAIKHLPAFDPTYDFVNLLYDFVWALISISPAFLIPVLIKIVIAERLANKN